MSTEERRERGGRSVAQMVVVGVLASAIGIAFGIAIDWFPADASTQAGPIDTLWDVLIVASVPMFVLVSVVVVVTVIGQQFAWTFEYNEGGRKFANTQLYLPVGESVKFNVRSNDVIHDFWVPDFRMK